MAVAPIESLAAAIDTELGGFDAFKDFAMQAPRFGSGWHGLSSKQTVPRSDFDSKPRLPCMAGADVEGKPVIGLDVWEHAYYLKYKNLRPKYIEASGMSSTGA